MTSQLDLTIDALKVPRSEIGILIIDHGSRRQESNDLLLQVVDTYKRSTDFEHVTAAHMELAEPSIQAAFDELVTLGVNLVVAFPYFLSPGRHWKNDIPTLVAAAAKRHSGVKHLVTAPLGLHPLMMQIITDRITTCLSQNANQDPTGCDVCHDAPACLISYEGNSDS